MNENTTVVPEVVDEEIETGPEAGGLVPFTNKEQVQDLIYFAENVNQVIEAQNKIRAAILKLTQPADWAIFGAGEKKTAEIGFAPANRIGSTLGVSYTNWFSEKITGTDDKGSWYRWEYQCDAIFRNRTIRVYGRAGSRDVFFGKKDGVFKELHEVNEGNIKMAAMRAAKKEGVKDLFGLHHLDPDYLKKYGIDLGSAGGHTFKDKDQKAEESQTVTVAIAEVTQKVGEKWTKYTVQDVEGGIYVTFSQTLAEEAKKAKVSKTPVPIVYIKDQYGLKLISINGIVSESRK